MNNQESEQEYSEPNYYSWADEEHGKSLDPSIDDRDTQRSCEEDRHTVNGLVIGVTLWIAIPAILGLIGYLMTDDPMAGVGWVLMYFMAWFVLFFLGMIAMFDRR